MTAESVKRVGRAELRRMLDAATNGGDWRVRAGYPADDFQPDGYRYVQFGPTEKAANGFGTDQLAPADAELIVAAVQLARRAVEANLLRSPFGAGEKARRTHCPQGHEYTSENTYRNDKNQRFCRACWAARKQPRCRVCKRSDVIEQGIYTRVSFPDGIGLVCDLCREKADEPDEDTIEWRGADVEVA